MAGGGFLSRPRLRAFGGVCGGGEACAQSQLEEAKTHKDTLGPLWGRVEAHFISLVLWEQKKKKQNP